MSTTAKESFSGPADLIGVAHTAAKGKFGTRNGAWSRWVCEAVLEKLRIDHPELLKSVQTLEGLNADQTELLAMVSQALSARPALKPELLKLLARGRRDTRRKAA